MDQQWWREWQEFGWKEPSVDRLGPQFVVDPKDTKWTREVKMKLTVWAVEGVARSDQHTENYQQPHGFLTSTNLFASTLFPADVFLDKSNFTLPAQHQTAHIKTLHIILLLYSQTNKTFSCLSLRTVNWPECPESLQMLNANVALCQMHKYN